MDESEACALHEGDESSRCTSRPQLENPLRDHEEHSREIGEGHEVGAVQVIEERHFQKEDDREEIHGEEIVLQVFAVGKSPLDFQG